MAVILKRRLKFQTLVNDILQMSMSENRYYDAVNSLADLQITRGYIDGTFRPNQNITRAEFSVFLSKTLAAMESENNPYRYS